MAEELRFQIKAKSPKAPVFRLPYESNLARMLCADLADARAAWLNEAAKAPDEYVRREQDDYLSDTNHDGEITDFHCLRHTCGAWLAMAGVHPKAVQQVMRHASITLTMDTYGHLFPGQEAAAVARVQEMLTVHTGKMGAIGTDDMVAALPDSARKQASQCDNPRFRHRSGSAKTIAQALTNSGRTGGEIAPNGSDF